jgi:hypothetical protein
VCLRVPRTHLRYLPVTTLAVALCGFVVVRGISLHNLDAVFNREVVGILQLGDVVEVSAALVVAALALIQVITGPPGPERVTVGSTSNSAAASASRTR